MKQVAQLSQIDRAAGCALFLAKSGRLELGDNIYGHYRSIFNHCKAIEFDEKTQGLLGRSRSFKVIDVGTNRKPV